MPSQCGRQYLALVVRSPGQYLFQFTMDDINDFMEDEDAGVPTPPAEPCDNRQTSAAPTLAAVLPTAPVSSYAVNGRFCVKSYDNEAMRLCVKVIVKALHCDLVAIVVSLSRERTAIQYIDFLFSPTNCG